MLATADSNVRNNGTASAAKTASDWRIEPLTKIARHVAAPLARADSIRIPEPVIRQLQDEGLVHAWKRNGVGTMVTLTEAGQERLKRIPDTDGALRDSATDQWPAKANFSKEPD